MKTAVAFVIVLALAGNIAAQEKAAADPPDYSRETLIRIFADNPIRPKVEPNVQWGFGYVDFKALGMRWRMPYLPIMAPLSGSIPWRNNGAFGSLPDPFELTGTQIASPPRTRRQARDMSAELKRIERTEKTKAKVTVEPE